jgi:DNA-binding Xre family transcriptional regulator
MAARRVGQQQLAELSGVSVSTVRLVQHGTGRRVQNKTLTALARALDWPDDHLVHVLLTGRAGADAPADPTMHDLYDALRRIEAQLASVNDRIGTVEHAIAARPAPDAAR